MGLWGLSLLGLLGRSLTDWSMLELSVAVGLRTFWQTGLFILAHEAMHQNLIPGSNSVNHRLGQCCVLLYGFLDYNQCRHNHRLHHKIPAQVGDPDFHDGLHPHPIAWYWHFLRGYLTPPQFCGFTIGWGLILLIGTQVCGWAIANILWFWFLPLVLSSMQLFVFGTYLPHRHGHNGVIPETGTTETGTTETDPISGFQIGRSLLSCYHFGTYHWAHHTSPKTPWYQLPQLAAQLRTAESSSTLMRQP
ncbi:MAG: hypothetical protein RLZZ511_750 [Cyanobacteriota bacterium]|jgi:beta-carotene ketolase (CrtW type)